MRCRLRRRLLRLVTRAATRLESGWTLRRRREARLSPETHRSGSGHRGEKQMGRGKQQQKLRQQPQSCLSSRKWLLLQQQEASSEEPHSTPASLASATLIERSAMLCSPSTASTPTTLPQLG